MSSLGLEKPVHLQLFYRDYNNKGPVARKPVFGVSDKVSFKLVSLATKTI